MRITEFGALSEMKGSRCEGALEQSDGLKASSLKKREEAVGHFRRGIAFALLMPLCLSSAMGVRLLIKPHD